MPATPLGIDVLEVLAKLLEDLRQVAFEGSLKYPANTVLAPIVGIPRTTLIPIIGRLLELLVPHIHRLEPGAGRWIMGAWSV